MGKEEVQLAISALESSIASLDKWALSFAALVAIGVVAGAIIGVRHWILDGKLRNLRHEEAQIHEKELAQLRKETAEANEKAERERLARIKIEEKLAPRRLSAEQQASIAAKLAPWAKLKGGGLQRADVGPLPPGFESGILSEQIVSALKAAGWNASLGTPRFGLPIGAVLGVTVLTSYNPRSIQVAKALVEALNAERIIATVLDMKRKGCEEQKLEQEEIDSNPWCSMIVVFVGEHP